MSNAASYYEQTARQRIDSLADPGSFVEFVGPSSRTQSPHLPLFDLPRQFDDGMIVGAAALDGQKILLAAQEGRFMGGAFGEVHGAKLVGLLRGAAEIGRDVVILFDTGGVRLQEANAGEMAVSEIVAAVLQARIAGVRVVGLIGGRSGCYGGGGIIAGCCSCLVVSEQGRISVSGPEVIETNKGVEEFDSKDRALVWRTMGGKHRYLIGGADLFVADSAPDFRAAAIAALGRPGALSLDVLEAEQRRLYDRIAHFGSLRDAGDIWAALGINDVSGIPDLTDDAFQVVAAAARASADDAR